MINGLPSAKARAVELERILDWGFRVFEQLRSFPGGRNSATEAQVWMGQQGTVPLTIRQVLSLHCRCARLAPDESLCRLRTANPSTH